MGKAEITGKELEKMIRDEVERALAGRATRPGDSLFIAGRACEEICRQVCLNAGLTQRDGFEDSLSLDKLKNLIKQHKLAPKTICEDITTIQRYRNMVAHNLLNLNPEDAATALNALSNLVNWYFKERKAPEEDPRVETISGGWWGGKLKKLRESKAAKYGVAALGGIAIGAATAVICTRKEGKEDKAQPS